MNRRQRRAAQALRREVLVADEELEAMCRSQLKLFDAALAAAGMQPAVNVMLNLGERGGTAWSVDDRVWFSRHKRRSHRARLRFPGEDGDWDPPTDPRLAWLVVIRQLEPGMRSKHVVLSAPIWLMPPEELVGLEGQIYEEYLSLVFDWLAPGPGKPPTGEPDELRQLLLEARRRVAGGNPASPPI
jgi:hypothetical protein